MRNTIKILRDIALEAHTARRGIESDDPLYMSIEFIEDMTNTAIVGLEAQIGGIDAA